MTAAHASIAKAKEGGFELLSRRCTLLLQLSPPAGMQLYCPSTSGPSIPYDEAVSDLLATLGTLLIDHVSL
jgi:hypothetical protein